MAMSVVICPKRRFDRVMHQLIVGCRSFPPAFFLPVCLFVPGFVTSHQQKRAFVPRGEESSSAQRESMSGEGA